MPEAELSEVELRVMEIKVKDKGLCKSLADGGRYEVKLLSVVSDGVPDNTYNLELGIFPVKNGGVIKFGPGGYPLYRNRAGQIPRYLNCQVSVLEDDSDIRNTAKLMAEVRRTEEFNSLTDMLKNLATGVNPGVGIGIDVAKALLDIGLNVLQNNGDDLWFRGYFSFNYKIDGYKGVFDMDSTDAKVKFGLFTA